MDLVKSTRSTSAKSKDAEALLRPTVAPRTRSQTRAQQGVSLSSLLQSRSEAAVSVHKAAPSSPLPDIDAADRNNPLAATDYVNDIYSYYRRVEPKFRVSPDYMGNQVRGTTPCRADGAECAPAVGGPCRRQQICQGLFVAPGPTPLQLRRVLSSNRQRVVLAVMLATYLHSK